MLHFVGFSQENYNEVLHDIVEAEMKGHSKKQPINKGVLQAANYDLKYHRCEWEVNPEVNYIKGAVTSYFVPVIAGFNQIYFDLSNSLTVDSVKYNGSNVVFSQATADVLQINLPITLPQNTLDSVTVFYQGVPINSTSLGGTFVQSSHLNDSIIWTLSEPYGAMEWWPCKQDLYDKIDSVDIIVTTPQKYRVGSQGLLVKETTVGLNKVYHWRHRYPIAAYLISLAVTNYAVFSNNVALSQGNLEVLNYVYPEDSSSNYNLSLGVIPVIQMMDTLFGVYPFMNEKYGHAQFSRGGGMEHQTMSSMYDFSQTLITHELAHQWFGDKVTCGSWKDIWLNEAFATYSVGIMFKNINPIWWKPWRITTIDAVVQQSDGSVYCPDTTNVSRIFDSRLTYHKGAYVLRMLEGKIGSNTFFQGVRNYVTDSNLSYNYARTDHLKAHLEAVSGQNLTEFFNDWFYGEGHPSYQVVWSQLGNNATFTINQTQSHASVSFFDMPVPIYVKGQNKDTTLVFYNTFSGEVFNANLPFTIDSVFFDPELWILSANPTVLSVDELENSENQFDIYPNPSATNVNVWVAKTKKVSSIKVYDALGRDVTPSIIKKANNFYELQTQSFSQGNYIIEIEINNKLIRQKWNKL
ncbi:MAG: M1 family aminopeptidase [Vicingaceae bacterium]|nr:M1 family aminopeptidase [Vicingaceae bacterium]